MESPEQEDSSFFFVHFVSDVVALLAAAKILQGLRHSSLSSCKFFLPPAPRNDANSLSSNNSYLIEIFWCVKIDVYTAITKTLSLRFDVSLTFEKPQQG